MQLRGKPQKPKRKKDIVETISLDSCSSLGSYTGYFAELGIALEDVVFEYDYSGYDGCDHYLRGSREEPVEAYNKRLAAYEKKLVAYNNWYEEHKEQIEKELARRAKRAKEIELQRLKKEARQFKKLEEKIKQTKKKLTQLGAIV